ncbi:MAG TPA: hypothetical protein VG847_07250 [Chitinophagaceae bacterium]|nr:hypothetical protein [Chitinophagaceae bacterium]
MIQNSTREELFISEDVPCIFVMIPYEPCMKSKSSFDAVVNKAISKAEKELSQTYKGDNTKLVIDKLHRLLQSIDHETHHKSMSILVSPLTEKVFYFDYEPVEWSRYKMN